MRSSHPGRFRDRHDAGRLLAATLGSTKLCDPVVLALPRGGVPVGAEVADALQAPLDGLVVRKVGAPGHPEYGIGAVAEGGVHVSDRRVLEMLGIDSERFTELVGRELIEVRRRLALYRGGRSLPRVTGRDVVIVDDGLATGVTAESAVLATRAMQPRRVVLAVPVAAADTATRLRNVADDVISVIESPDFVAVGRWYDDFDQTPDHEVVALLSRARDRVGRERRGVVG